MGLFGRARSDGSGDRWIVIGLGNPGEKYAGNRHNLGVMILEELLSRSGAHFKRHKSGCATAEVGVGDGRMVLARPMSYMNESGRPARELIRWYKASLDHVVVVHDELDVPFGEVRIKMGGGTAGHNGLNSIASHLGSKDFLRVRAGIGRPRGRRDAGDHVLSDFTSSEKKELDSLIQDGADAVERVVDVGPDRAMNEVNTRTR